MRSDSFGPTLSSASNGLSQQEVLKHKLPFPPGERATADLAGYLAVGCLGPSFDFNDFIKRFAVRACEWIECASSHDTPPMPALPHRKLEQERCPAPLSGTAADRYVGIGSRPRGREMRNQSV
jgi:hypothetical protein